MATSSNILWGWWKLQTSFGFWTVYVDIIQVWGFWSEAGPRFKKKQGGALGFSHPNFGGSWICSGGKWGAKVQHVFLFPALPATQRWQGRKLHGRGPAGVAGATVKSQKVTVPLGKHHALRGCSHDLLWYAVHSLQEVNSRKWITHDGYVFQIVSI